MTLFCEDEKVREKQCMAPEVLIDSLENISYKLYKKHQAVRKKPEGVRQWSCLLFLLSSYRFAVIRFAANFRLLRRDWRSKRFY